MPDITITVTLAQMLDIQAAADRGHMTVSDFVRLAAVQRSAWVSTRVPIISDDQAWADSKPAAEVVKACDGCEATK